MDSLCPSLYSSLTGMGCREHLLAAAVLMAANLLFYLLHAVWCRLSLKVQAD